MVLRVSLWNGIKSVSSSSNYRKYHTGFFHSGYFLALLLQYISTGVSRNVPMKDDMKNYLVPSRISIGFYLEARQWGGVGGRQKGWRENRIAHV